MKIIKIGGPLVISAIMITFTGLMLRIHLKYEGIVTDLSSWSSFFTVFGVIFAIVAGFLLVTVLNRYSNLNQTIEDELNAVESVRDFLVYLDDRQQIEIDKIKHALANYVTSVANTEWAEMSAPRIPMNSDTSEELYEVMRSGKRIKVSEERDSIVLSALIETISEITKLRTRRIALANERLPPRLRALMLFMSATLIGGFVSLGVQGIFAAHFVNTVSPTFLMEIIEGKYGFVEPPIRQELTFKWNAGCALGILNAPDPSFNPAEDNDLFKQYTPKDHKAGKRANKRFLQEYLKLIQDDQAPMFFWPSRLDTIQKGCQLLADILYSIVSKYWEMNLQIVFVANGEFQKHFRNIVTFHNFEHRVAVCNFNERLARQAYAAADFILMPSKFEPCGLPQMIGPIYGALPVAHDTGGIHDTVSHIDVKHERGNGFLFEVFDANGLSWAIDQAMQFHMLPEQIKSRQIKRIMEESIEKFNHSVTARKYIDLYENMLQRPLIV